MRSLVVRALVASLATIAAWSMVPAVAQATFPGTNGKLAFGSARSGYPADNDLYTIANNVAIRITNLDQDELNPSWSPSGNQIVFERNAGLRSDIWIANADGSSARRLTTNPGNDSRPAFSNTGTRIVYASDRSGTGISGMSDLFVMDTNGGNQVNITNTPTIDENYPSWSPDGTAIAFSRDGDIYRVSPAGTNLTPVTTSAVMLVEPDWSPTGSQIVFHQGIDGDDELWKVNANGSGLVRLTQNGSVVEEHPVWSPQGDKIAFIRGAFDEAELYTMNADGTGVTRITSNAVMDASPAWQVVPTTAVPPNTVISAEPPAQTQSTSARFEFSSDQVDATFSCRLDGAAPAPCTSPRDYANLAVGQHSFEVAAIGRTGIADPVPASSSWTVNAPPPPPPPPPPPAIPGTGSSTTPPPATVTDKAAPSARLTFAKGQRASGLLVVVLVNEAGTVTGSGSVAAPGGASKLYKFKSVSRSVKANEKVRLRLKLPAKALKAIKRALRRRKLTARITVTAKDRAGNKKTSTARIKLKL